jgi:hypothetical protein
MHAHLQRGLGKDFARFRHGINVHRRIIAAAEELIVKQDDPLTRVAGYDRRAYGSVPIIDVNPFGIAIVALVLHLSARQASSLITEYPTTHLPWHCLGEDYLGHVFSP